MPVAELYVVMRVRFETFEQFKNFERFGVQESGSGLFVIHIKISVMQFL